MVSIHVFKVLRFIRNCMSVFEILEIVQRHYIYRLPMVFLSSFDFTIWLILWK